MEEQPAPDISLLAERYNPLEQRFRPEDSPFTTLFADITHRCNMACRNCYIPVRDLPDLPVDWLYDILARLPHRTRIRLVGAEPTMREDLPEIIAKVREMGHLPVVLSNGLKLGRASYVARLKEAGLGTCYLSLNGGLRDDLYLEIDELACADRKLKALDNLLAARIHVTTGTIIVPGVNDAHLPEFLEFLVAKGVRDIHLRSVGEVGNYMQGKSLRLDALEEIFRASLPASLPQPELIGEYGSSRDFRAGRVSIQLTEWPELGSLERGRITPDGWLEPMFESIVANAGHY
ncbi:radical SAM protein [Alteraurantiacibacter aestuarii]|uniref:radical SAM protein n=1 Tax=Alteraurantiacibacter aestuarii TaxID=650004 RepID=UPI0031DC250F